MGAAGRFLLLVALSQLAACGFSLRGNGMDPAFTTLYLNPQNGGGEIAAAMRRGLADAGVTVLDEARRDAPELRLGNEQSRERVVSVTGNARAGEYQLTLSADFELRRDGTAVIGPETVSTQAVYVADPENIAAKTAEADLLRREMRRDLAAVIQRRLRSLQP